MVGKRMRAAYEGINRNQAYSSKESVKLIKNQSPVRFDEMCEVAINLNIDPRKSEQNLRGVLALPHGNGKTVQVIVFAEGAKADEARAAGADIVGGADIIEKIQQDETFLNKIDRCIATPTMMVQISKVARALGSRGLMPNPKLGTVTTDVALAAKNAKSGTVEYRTDKGGIIHLGIGKISFSEEQLSENLKAVVSHISKSRPAGVKGTFIKKVSLSSTMGIGIKVDLATI